MMRHEPLKKLQRHFINLLLSVKFVERKCQRLRVSIQKLKHLKDGPSYCPPIGK